MELSVIVPVYNEARTVAQILDRLLALEVRAQVIAVDDGSTDSSASVLEDYHAKHSIVHLRHTRNRGKGAAIVTGLQAAEGTYTVIQDADLEYDPADIVALYKTAVRHNADAVFGSRTMNPSSGISYRRFYWGGRFLTLLANLLYGVNITDESTCYKLVRTELMKSLDLRCHRFEFCPELVAKLGKRKIKIFEIPITYNPRKLEEGKKIRWYDGVHAIWTLLKNRL